MNICELHQQGNQDCLLFFAGWGMCPEPFAALPPGEVDVLLIYDYRCLNVEEMQKIGSFLQELHKKRTYRQLHLLAWSMGVRAASRLFAEAIFPLSALASAIAVGGTCQPIHDWLGIPEQNFADMAEQLSPARVKKFHRSMFADEQEAARFIDLFQKGGRSFEELRQELLTLGAAYTKNPDLPDMYTDRIVTGRDRIFPARNQVRAWGRKNCRTLSLPHFPFYHWQSWSAIIQELASAGSS
ncbi:MAG: DUF452 family protein [Candidatus Electrothrix sp. EH2]|nr:DUF452 family protein [Candidatus Electrothrix sp. EH2]